MNRLMVTKVHSQEKSEHHTSFARYEMSRNNESKTCGMFLTLESNFVRSHVIVREREPFIRVISENGVPQFPYAFMPYSPKILGE